MALEVVLCLLRFALICLASSATAGGHVQSDLDRSQDVPDLESNSSTINNATISELSIQFQFNAGLPGGPNLDRVHFKDLFKRQDDCACMGGACCSDLYPGLYPQCCSVTMNDIDLTTPWCCPLSAYCLSDYTSCGYIT
jgi:hypothetical protein